MHFISKVSQCMAKSFLNNALVASLDILLKALMNYNFFRKSILIKTNLE
jgi:hypothetical protein